MTAFAPTLSTLRQFGKGNLYSAWTIAAVLLALVAVIDQDNFLPVLVFAINALISTVPFIATAVFLIAYLKAAGAESVIAEAFKGRENRMIVLAALFGGLAPFCSCEVIPFITGLLAVGAPLSAVMAFWLSSPLIDPPTILITAAALGWPFAVGKAIAAVGVGLAGGFAVKALTAFGGFKEPIARRKQSRGCCGTSSVSSKPAWKFWRNSERVVRFRHEFLDNAFFLLKWLCLAYVLEALLVNYVPANLIAGMVGGEGSASISIAALVGMPAYLNSYVAPALIAGLVEQGMTNGSAMAFLVSGAVSSIPAMAAVWSIVRWPVFASYILLGLSGAIVSGIAFEILT